MRLLLVIASFAVGILAAALSDSAEARPLELAVQDDPVLLYRSYGDAHLALDRAAAMGATRVRVNLRWAYVMPRSQARARRRPTEIRWDFRSLERLLADATARGLKLQVTLTGEAPAWATGNRRVGYTRPSAARFAEFARIAATAFAGRIDRWSIWNEPNWHRLLAPRRKGPALYRKLYRASYAAIKAADPSADVLLGEFMPGANRRRSTPVLRFLRSMMRGTRLKADGVALHPYNFARRPSKARNRNPDIVEMGSLSRMTKALDVLRRRKALTRPGGGAMPLYLTEFGYFTAGPVRVNPRTHAKWLAEAYRMADRNPRVAQLLQYQLVDPWPKNVTWRSAVLNKNGTPRPAYRALARLASRR